MIRRLIVDAGPLVALLSERDRYHAWAKDIFGHMTPPLLICEAVLTEAWHLLRGTSKGQLALLDLLSSQIVTVESSIVEELAPIRRLVIRYRDRPMSLADASLVRLAELFDDAEVITIDEDFAVYRKHGRQTIPLISPFA